MGAEHVVDGIERQAECMETVEPGLLRKIHRRRIALVLARAGVDQDGVLRRAHHEGPVGDDEHSGCGVEYDRVHLREMAVADHRIECRKHVLGLSPRAVALDDAVDRHVADLDFPHADTCPLTPRSRYAIVAPAREQDWKRHGGTHEHRIHRDRRHGRAHGGQSDPQGISGCRLRHRSDAAGALRAVAPMPLGDPRSPISAATSRPSSPCCRPGATCATCC